MLSNYLGPQGTQFRKQNNNTWRFEVSNVSVVDSTTLVKPFVWSHVIGTYTRGTGSRDNRMDIYINGALDATNPAAAVNSRTDCSPALSVAVSTAGKT